MLTVHKFIKIIKDCVFPVFCFGCSKEGEWLCQDCFLKLENLPQKSCPVCHLQNSSGAVCLECKSVSFLDSQISIAKYEQDKIIGQIIYAFKYNNAREVFSVFEKMLTDFFIKNKNIFYDVDFVAPVPLHPRRFAQRGFNQSELLAQKISEIINKKFCDCLSRVKYTQVQAKLQKLERIKNVADAFEIKSGSEVFGKKILLVDDVFTTGSTMQECARVLKQNGAQKVCGFTVARGE